MRPIKFRAWDKKRKKFWHDFRIHPFGTVHPATGMLTANKMDYWDYDTGYPQEDLVLLQYTGLKDKNGVEIYEGDIVRWGDGGTADTCVVVYDYAEFRLEINDQEADREYMPDHRSLEVIGNIYENEELLK